MAKPDPTDRLYQLVPWLAVFYAVGASITTSTRPGTVTGSWLLAILALAVGSRARRR